MTNVVLKSRTTTAGPAVSLGKKPLRHLSFEVARDLLKVSVEIVITRLCKCTLTANRNEVKREGREGGVARFLKKIVCIRAE